MLVQQKDHSGKLVQRYAEWTPAFWDAMVKKWGNRLRWVKVPENVNITFRRNKYVNNLSINKQKYERK